MFPVLFSIGTKAVSSFGVFLALGFLIGVFLIWRLSRAWDLDEEKILDLILLTFLGGLIGARIYFGLEHPQLFAENLYKLVLINKFPGLSFWGAILGGWLTLFTLARSKKIDFWQICDIASVGFLAGLILTDLGCFFGSCDVGISSNSFLAVNMAGILGKRFPTQALEAILLIFVLLKLWSSATKFHPRGKIVSLALIYIGLIKFLMEPLKEKVDEGQFLSLVLIIIGIFIFSRVTKRNLISDLRNILAYISNLITDSLTRQNALARFKKYCYNQKTSIFWKVRNLKKLPRRFNVKFSYKNNKLY